MRLICCILPKTSAEHFGWPLAEVVAPLSVSFENPMGWYLVLVGLVAGRVQK